MEGGQNGFSTLRRTTTTTATTRHTSLLCRIAGISVVFLLFVRVKGLCFCRAKHVPIVSTHMFSDVLHYVEHPTRVVEYLSQLSILKRKEERRKNEKTKQMPFRMRPEVADDLSTNRWLIHEPQQRPKASSAIYVVCG